MKVNVEELLKKHYYKESDAFWTYMKANPDDRILAVSYNDMVKIVESAKSDVQKRTDSMA